MSARYIVTVRPRYVVDSVSANLGTLLALYDQLPENEREDWWQSWWSHRVTIPDAIAEARQRLWPTLGEPQGGEW